MVLYGNNYNRKFNLSTAVLAALAGVIVNLIWNTVADIQASTSNGGAGGGDSHSLGAAGVALLVLAGALLVLIAVGILFTVVQAHVWPVDVKDLLRVLAGHPGSLFELANKCNRCGVSFVVAYVYVCSACY